MVNWGYITLLLLVELVINEGYENCNYKEIFALFVSEKLHTFDPGGGGTQMARGGIRLVHGLTKSTLITYFSGMKKDPKYVFLHAFFLICLSCSFQNLSV